MSLIKAAAEINPKTFADGGTHVIANFTSPQNSLLVSFASFRSFVNETIDELGLVKVGEVFHDFDGGGFTGVVCLSESHLSIHTWPERNYVTFDVYLSNFSRDNSDRVETIYSSVLSFFEASVTFETKLLR